MDFLRYGRVSLPLTVARDAFLRDMDYYGIEVDASLIGVTGLVVQGATSILECRKQLRAEALDLKARRECIELVEECFLRFSTDGSLTFKFRNVSDFTSKDFTSKERKFCHLAEKVNQESAKSCLWSILERHYHIITTPLVERTQTRTILQAMRTRTISL